MPSRISQGIRPKPSFSLLLVMESHDPFQHSFLRGVIIEGLGQMALPCTIVRMAGVRERGPTVRHWRHCRVVMLPRLHLEWLPAFVLEEIIHVLRLCVGTLRMIKRQGSTHIVIRNVWQVAMFLLLLRPWLRKPLCYQDAFFNEEAKIAGLKTSARPSLLTFLRVALCRIKVALKHWCVRRCDRLFVMSEEMKRYYVGRKVSERKITVMPMGVLSSMLTPAAARCPAVMDLPQNRFVIVYSGSMALSRSPEIMIDAFEKAWALDSRLFLLMVGGDEDELRRLAEVRPVIQDKGRYRLTGRIPFGEVFPVLRCARAGASLVPPDDIYRVASVTKLIEMMACGLPVIANTEIPEQEELVRTTGAVIPCRYTVDSIADAMRRVVELGPELERMGHDGREYAARERSYDRLTERFLTVLEACQRRPCKERESKQDFVSRGSI